MRALYPSQFGPIPAEIAGSRSIWVPWTGPGAHVAVRRARPRRMARTRCSLQIFLSDDHHAESDVVVNAQAGLRILQWRNFHGGTLNCRSRDPTRMTMGSQFNLCSTLRRTGRLHMSRASRCNNIIVIVIFNYVLGSQEEWDAKLGQKFRRIFAERGIDFFDRYDSSNGALDKITPQADLLSVNEKQTAERGDISDDTSDSQLMTAEMLFKMRSEIIPRLQ